MIKLSIILWLFLSWSQGVPPPEAVPNPGPPSYGFMDALRDPLWQFVGAILTVVTIAVAFLIFFLQKTKKRLAYEIITSTPLLTVREEIEGRIQIEFEGQPVQNVQLVVLKVVNSGNVAITSGDFEIPLRIVFGESVNLLSAEVVRKAPANLPASVVNEGSKILFEPTLLNPKDWLEIKALVNGYNDEPTVDGRIVGVRAIRRNEDGSPLFLAGMSAASCMLFLGVFILLLSTYNAVGIGLLAGGYFLGGSIMLRSPFYRKIFRRALSRYLGLVRWE